jgi:hypothetical protein
MSLVDDRGRLFGRLNLFDAALIGFAIVLIPIAYGTYLLFRVPRPAITSVKRVEITKEERRVGGPNLVAKLKVQGSGLRPMLRASIDDAPAIGFVFENPNSADLLVGAVAPGSHDLVLYDGVQEVARAPKAVRIQPVSTQTATVRVRFDGPPEVTSLIKAGDRDLFPDERAAVVTDIDKGVVILRLGIDAVDGGWQYRGHDLKPGTDLTLTTADYIVKGTVLRVSTGDKR